MNLRSQAPRRGFLRRTKATAPPEAAEVETVTASGLSTTTNKFSRRGGTNFKNRNDIEKDAAKNQTEVIEKEETEKRTRPSFGNGARRNERPQANRNFARRRPGGAIGESGLACTTYLRISRDPLDGGEIC